MNEVHFTNAGVVAHLHRESINQCVMNNVRHCATTFLSMGFKGFRFTGDHNRVALRGGGGGNGRITQHIISHCRPTDEFHNQSSLKTALWKGDDYLHVCM